MRWPSLAKKACRDPKRVTADGLRSGLLPVAVHPRTALPSTCSTLMYGTGSRVRLNRCHGAPGRRAVAGRKANCPASTVVQNDVGCND